MKIAGSFAVPTNRQKVWQIIRDPSLMAKCIPGCDEIEALSATSYRARVRTSVGPIKAVFALVVEVVDECAPVSIRSITRGEEGSRASILIAKNLVTLQEQGADLTEVVFESDLSITGRLGKFGFGIMRKKAEALSREFADALRGKLTETP